MKERRRGGSRDGPCAGPRRRRHGQARPPASHGRRPLLVRRLMLRTSGWRGSCAAWETEEGGPWSDPWPARRIG